mgnify:CR=1 FL=1|jgi:ABC-type multidrug transport system ATPase subunit
MQIINLNKSYNQKTVFHDLKYRFDKGSVYWLQGRNGVGKSTLIRVLLGMEKADRGWIQDKQNRQLYIPEIPLTEEWLTIRENIDLLYKISGFPYPQFINWSEKLCIKEKDMDSLAMECSLGTNMKIAFSLLYSEVDIGFIVIDEAFSHFDQNMQKNMIDFLIEYAKQKNSIVLFTHHDSLEKANQFKTIKQIILEEGALYEARDV